MLLTMTVAAPATSSAATIGAMQSVAADLANPASTPALTLGRLTSRTRSPGCGAQVLGPRTGQRSRALDKHLLCLGRKRAEVKIHLDVDGWCRPSAAVSMSNMPLQMTRAVQLSVEVQRAGAARLTR